MHGSRCQPAMYVFRLSIHKTRKGDSRGHKASPAEHDVVEPGELLICKQGHVTPVRIVHSPVAHGLRLTTTFVAEALHVDAAIILQVDIEVVASVFALPGVAVARLAPWLGALVVKGVALAVMILKASRHPTPLQLSQHSVLSPVNGYRKCPVTIPRAVRHSRKWCV